MSGGLGIRGAIRGFAALAGATVAGQIIGFVALAIVARRVGPSNLGDYTFAAVLTSYVFVITDLGLSVYGIREIARAPGRTREIVGQVLAVRILAFFALSAVVLPLSAVLAPTDHARTLIFIMTVGYLCQAVGLDWVLRARGGFGMMAVLILAGQVVYGALVPVLVTDGYEGTKVYAWLNVLGFAVTFLGAAVVAIVRYGRPRMRATRSVLWMRVRASVPLGLALVLTLVYTGINTLLLGYLRPASDVGVYGVALRLPLAVAILSSVWISAFLPHASELAARNPRALLDQLGRLVSLAIVAALPLAAISAVVATPLMEELFGSEFDGAGAPFRWLMLWAALGLVATNFNNALLAFDEESSLLRGTALAVFVSVAMTFALAPSQGTGGAAFGALVAEATLVVYSIRRLRLRAGTVSLETGRILRAVAITAVAAGLTYALRDALPAVAGLAVGGLVYAAGALVFRVVSIPELRDLLKRDPPPGAQPATAASSSSISGTTAPGA